MKTCLENRVTERADSIDDWRIYADDLAYFSNDFYEDFKNEIDFNALAFYCVQVEKVKPLKRFIKEGLISIEETDSENRTLLIWAAIHDSINCFKLLVELGANFTGVVEDWAPPITQAAAFNSPRVLTRLLQLGVNPNYQHTPISWPPLYAAIERRTSMEVVKILMEAGADISLKNSHGHSVETLLDKGYYTEAEKYIDDFIYKQNLTKASALARRTALGRGIF